MSLSGKIYPVGGIIEKYNGLKNWNTIFVMPATNLSNVATVQQPNDKAQVLGSNSMIEVVKKVVRGMYV